MVKQMNNLKIIKSEELDRSKILIDNFEIQHTTGRGETTLWVPGKGWLTLEQICKEMKI